MSILSTLIILIFCHLIGDYVLQSDFLAKTKGGELVSLVRALRVILCAVLYSIWIMLAVSVYICSSSYR